MAAPRSAAGRESAIFWDVPGTWSCPQCGKSPIHHSRPRSWIERLRRQLTGLVPFRCHACNWRGWRNEFVQNADGPREIHRALTDSEIAKLEPDHSEGERM
jgi:hypothetical protein